MFGIFEILKIYVLAIFFLSLTWDPIEEQNKMLLLQLSAESFKTCPRISENRHCTDWPQHGRG